MTSPVVAGSTSGTAASSATLTAALVMPANVGPKDVLHAILHIKGAQTTVTWPAGWVATNELTLSHTLSSAYKFADGTEGGTTVNVTHDVAGTAEYHARRITGASHNVSPVTTLLASSINPPSRAWTWGSSDILGIAMAMCADFTTSAIGFPGTYPGSHLNNTNTGDATQRLMSATAGFTQVGSPEDPSAFSATGSGSSVNKAGTVVFMPAAPQFIAAGAGSARAGTGTVTPALPAGHIADDILLLFCQTKTAGGVPSTPTGWTAFAQAPLSTSTQLTAFWKRDNGSESAPVVTCNDTDHTLAVISCYRGVHIGYDPGKATASQSTDHTTAASFAQNTSFGLATTDGEIFDNNSTLVLAIATFSSATSLSTLTDSNAVFAAHAIKANVNTALGGTGGGAIGVGDAQKLTGAPAGAYPLQPIFFASGGSSTISYYAIPLAPEITANPALVAGTTGRVTSSISVAQTNAAVVSGTTGRVTSTIAAIDSSEALVVSGSTGHVTAALVGTNGEYAVLGASVAGVTASVVIAETDQATVAGTLGEVTASVVVTLGDVAVVAGTMAAVTAALVISQGDVLTLAGSLGAVTASIDIDDSAIDANDAEISGSMGAVTAEVVIVQGPGLTLTGSLGSVTGSAAVVVRTALDLAGMLGQVSADVAIAQGLRLTASGTFGRVTAAVVAANGLRASISGTARRVGFAGSVLITTPEFLIVAGSMRRVKSSMHVSMLSGIQRPTDPLAIIDMIGYDRTIDMPTVDRAITMPAVDRSVVMPAIDRTIVMSEGD